MKLNNPENNDQHTPPNPPTGNPSLISPPVSGEIIPPPASSQPIPPPPIVSPPQGQGQGWAPNFSTPIPPKQPRSGVMSTASAKAEPKVYGRSEQLLLLFALALGILFDRLVLKVVFLSSYSFFSAIFWIIFSVGFYIFRWNIIKKDIILWIVAGFTLLLCCWNFIFDYRSEFGNITSLVIPAVLMAHAQYSMGDLNPKKILPMVFRWICGFMIMPFTAISHFLGSGKSVTSKSENSNLKKVLVGLALSLPLVIVVLYLLSDADMVFSYFVTKVFGGFNLASFFFHLILALIAAMLFYSFLWNISFSKADRSITQIDTTSKIKIDPIVSAVVLSMVVIVYLLFSVVQFTYLFARTGLPLGITYSDYAREGFAQIIVVAAINFSIFGIFVMYTQRKSYITVLLVALLACTGVMLASSMVRLTLYIQHYQMTWLRLLSFWFVVFLVAVLILCVVRLFRETLPIVAVSAILLLAWYTLLGYSNPDALIVKYNLTYAKDPVVWLDENRYYLTHSLSNNAVLELADNGIDLKDFYRYRLYSNAFNGYSYSSHKLEQKLRVYYDRDVQLAAERSQEQSESSQTS